jgi:hypothetical protein
VGENASFFTG